MMKSRKKEFKRKIFWFTDTPVDPDQYLSGYGNTSFVLVYQHGFF